MEEVGKQEEQIKAIKKTGRSSIRMFVYTILTMLLISAIVLNPRVKEKYYYQLFRFESDPNEKAKRFETLVNLHISRARKIEYYKRYARELIGAKKWKEFLSPKIGQLGSETFNDNIREELPDKDWFISYPEASVPIAIEILKNIKQPVGKIYAISILYDVGKSAIAAQPYLINVFHKNPKCKYMAALILVNIGYYSSEIESFLFDRYKNSIDDPEAARVTLEALIKLGSQTTECGNHFFKYLKNHKDEIFKSFDENPYPLLTVEYFKKHYSLSSLNNRELRLLVLAKCAGYNKQILNLLANGINRGTLKNQLLHIKLVADAASWARYIRSCGTVIPLPQSVFDNIQKNAIQQLEFHFADIDKITENDFRNLIAISPESDNIEYFANELLSLYINKRVPVFIEFTYDAFTDKNRLKLLPYFATAEANLNQNDSIKLLNNILSDDKSRWRRAINVLLDRKAARSQLDYENNSISDCIKILKAKIKADNHTE